MSCVDISFQNLASVYAFLFKRISLSLLQLYMNTDKKIGILSNALAVEIKVLLAYYYSDEEIVEILKLFFKDTEKLIRALFIRRLMQICKDKKIYQLFYVSIKLYFLNKQIQAEFPMLVKESCKIVRVKVNGVFNVEAPLSFNGALSAIVDDEICNVLSEINSVNGQKYDSQDNSTNSLLF